MKLNNIIFKLLIFILIVISAASQGITPKFLGCYLGDNLLSLGEDFRVIPSISTKSCSEFCSGKQYLFFILKNDICYCSKNYISRLMKEFDHHCSINCAGNISESCGGPPNYVSSYITDNTKSGSFLNHRGYPIPIYLGCYTETPNDDENRILKGPAEPYTNNTPQRCSDICFKMGYLHFGVTYGAECWCGNQKPLKSAKVEDSNCDTPCSGDSKQICGGGWKMGIYSTGITDYAPKKYVGCFEDDTSKKNDASITFQMGKNNSPKRCINLCNTHQIKYAFVKNNTCECKSSLPPNSLMRSFSDCNVLCSENPVEYCGGSITSSIYNTFYSDPRGELGVKLIGCFNSFKRHPVLSGWRITISRLTPRECVKSCFSRRFPYAALVSSKECLCSNLKPPNDAKTDTDMCKIPCSGSSQEICGGYNAMSVYTTGLKWNTEAIGNNYLGCFEENQLNRIFNGYSKSFTVNTPEFCSELCYKFGYYYSGVTYKSECFCGNQPPNDSKFPKVDDKQCNTKCTGDANQFCGGGWRMGVFATGLQKLPLESRPMGCFILQEDTLNNMKFELINTNTPLVCSAICNNAGYLFAGVTGVNCFCGNRVPDNDYNVGESECDTVCNSDSSHMCGGEDRVHIYDISSMITKIKVQPSTTNFVDEFNSLNLQSLWSHEIYIPQEPDFDFVVYNNIEGNSMTKNGELVIKPSIQEDDFIKRGQLLLKGCTKKEGSVECTKHASSYNIIPPVLSAKITTINHFSFLYGQLEVIAMLPIGDWIVSEIAVVSKTNEQNKLILAKLFGNTNLKCKGIDEGATVLKYGLNIDEKFHLKSKIMRSTKPNGWSNDYHSFVLNRTPENIVFKIDGESSILDTSNIPLDIIFDSEYYITIGVSVGGLTSFDNDCKNNGKSKPWNNFDPKAALNFWKDKDQWYSTWNDVKSTLRVKSVNFTAVENSI